MLNSKKGKKKLGESLQGKMVFLRRQQQWLLAPKVSPSSPKAAARPPGGAKGRGGKYRGRDGETPREIVKLLGLEDAFEGGAPAALKRLLHINKGRLKGLNSKSRLMKGTEVLLPERRGGRGCRVGAGKSMRFMKFESGVGKG